MRGKGRSINKPLSLSVESAAIRGYTGCGECQKQARVAAETDKEKFYRISSVE